MVIRKAQKQAKSDRGVLLPDVDPVIGEAVLTTLYANPTATLPEIAIALVKQAPNEEYAHEAVRALFETLICRQDGELRWVHDSAAEVLVGIRRSHFQDRLKFGAQEWPLEVLTTCTPVRHVLHTEDAAHVVYLASPSLKGVVLRMSEVVALATMSVEVWGGQIIEDRKGPDVAQKSAIEKNMSTRFKARRLALKTYRQMAITRRGEGTLGPEYLRAPMAEAFPGSMREGDRIVVEGHAEYGTYLVEERITSDYVIIVAEHSDQDSVPAGAWIREDGKPPVDIGGVPPHVGFTDVPTANGVVDDESESDEPEPGTAAP